MNISLGGAFTGPALSATYPMRSTATRTALESVGSHVVLAKGKPAKIILEIEGDTLAFRQKGSKNRYRISLADAFREAVIRTL